VYMHSMSVASGHVCICTVCPELVDMCMYAHQFLYKHSYETSYVNGDPVRYGE